MELVIQVGFPNGNFSAKVDDFSEAEAVHDWLVKQGLIQGQRAQTVEAEVVDVTAEADAAAQAEQEAAAQAEADAAAKAAAEAAAKTIAKREAAKKAAAAKATEKADKPTVSVADVTKAVTDYAAKFGPTEARALFSRFGVSRGGDLKPEQFEDFIATARDYIARDIKASDAVLPDGSEGLM